MSATLRDHALSYARAGLEVFPLRTRSKEPATRHGFKDATTDLAVIGDWWTRHPGHNIGLRPPENVVVLDVDPRNGGTLESLGITGAPETWCAATGSGGWHLWYRHRGPVRGKAAVDGVDVKTSAGYLVAPPSIHPDTGRRYEWLNREPIRRLPGSLAALITAPPRRELPRTLHGGHDNAGLVRFVAEAAAGNRNQALFWAACRAVETGCNSDVLDQLEAAGVSAGLPEVEVRRTIASATRRTNRAVSA